MWKCYKTLGNWKERRNDLFGKSIRAQTDLQTNFFYKIDWRKGRPDQTRPADLFAHFCPTRRKISILLSKVTRFVCISRKATGDVGFELKAPSVHIFALNSWLWSKSQSFVGKNSDGGVGYAIFSRIKLVPLAFELFWGWFSLCARKGGLNSRRVPARSVSIVSFLL